METTEDYLFPPVSFKPLLTEISGLLRSTSSTLAVAETTTGGLVSASLLSVSGASKFFVGGATLYTTKSRRVWAGWTDENLVNYIGPTPELVTELAVNVREQMDVTYCIGESGATGPTVPGAPFVHVAGQTCISVVSREGFATRVVNTGVADREKNMMAFAKASLVLLRDVLAGDVKLEQQYQPGSEGSEATKL
ncbi:competence/damage-inducible CinA family protein [Suillus spraguei]|nr:competence/damage-inducible CinA family protein [Suillus spraguei]